MAYCTSYHHAGHRWFPQPTAGGERYFDGRGRPPSHCPDCDRKILDIADNWRTRVTRRCCICGNSLAGKRRGVVTCSQGCRSRLHQVRRRTAGK